MPSPSTTRRWEQEEGVGCQYVMSASNPATVEMRASDLLAHARSDDVPLALWLPGRRVVHHDLGVAVQ
ncbi:hypothetical protein BH23CHL7_BH23CHL7_20320 [soil metagenome]